MGACLSSKSTVEPPIALQVARPLYQALQESSPLPIATVPFDVLLLIFNDFCLDTSRERHLKHARVLASVCYTWRHFVLHEPGLWRRVYVRGERSLHDLRYALDRSRDTYIELGVDYAEIRGVWPVPEGPPEMFVPIFQLVNQHMDRVTKLSLCIRLAAFDSLRHLKAPGPWLTELALCIHDRDAMPVPAGQVDASLTLFSGFAPKLTTLSITGMHIPRWCPVTRSPIRVLHIHGLRAEAEDLRMMLSFCSPSLQELHIHNCAIVDTPPPSANGTIAMPLVALPPCPALQTLELDGLNRHGNWDRAPTTTSRMIASLSLGRLRTIKLSAHVWAHLDNEAQVTFTTLSCPLDSLEFTREIVDSDLSGVTVRAQTQAGHTREIECITFSSSQQQLSAMFSVTPDARTVRRLALPLDWVPAFLRHSSGHLDLLEELTLTYNRNVFYPLPDTERGVVHRGAKCPFLHTVIVDIARASVVPRIRPTVVDMLLSLVNFESRRLATLILRGAIAHNPVDLQRFTWRQYFENVIVDD